jgi:BTB/POZ domain
MIYIDRGNVQGRYFIDRSPDCFGYVLEFLRGHEVELPSDPRELRLLWKEADFYGLEGLKELIPKQPKLPQPEFDFLGRLLEGQEELVMALDNVLSSIPPLPCMESLQAELLEYPNRANLLQGFITSSIDFNIGFFEAWAMKLRSVVVTSHVYITNYDLLGLSRIHDYASSEYYRCLNHPMRSWVRLHMLNCDGIGSVRRSAIAVNVAFFCCSRSVG